MSPRCFPDTESASSRSMVIPNDIQRKRKGFTFLELPAELWTYICEMVVVQSEPIKAFSKLGSKKNESTVMQPGISRTCRLIRKETIPMFYERNTFMAYDQIAMPAQLVSWVTAIGWTNRASLRRLYVQGTETQTFNQIEEYCVEAGITFPIWKTNTDRVTGAYVHQLSFIELNTSRDDERLQQDLNLLRVAQ